jgi:hypothetical protein
LLLRGLLSLLLLYILAAYLVIPFAWKWFAKDHPSFVDHPRVTRTADDHPGDPLNVALMGTREQLVRSMQLAGWDPAASLGIRSDLEIAADTLLSRPDDQAPVSNLYLFGRKEDLAFEQPVGDSPRKRHHVRFWQTNDPATGGRPVWIGSASYDERVGLSHTTGQITHHISADVDTERDHLFDNLKSAEVLSETYSIDNFHTTRSGRNGGGDLWQTDGKLLVGVIRAEN